MVHVWVAKANSRSIICNLEQMRIRRQLFSRESSCQSKNQAPRMEHAIFRGGNEIRYFQVLSTEEET
ncbi:hypothetical protein HETIRDRAFT_169734 [Heterobasidion irregulare TC 32-1]|uniref:Uncharacterized protein n=1 Tax=Heterobasidion irregulare (strain TC 32-1) TaxID=747525 RepID=W4K6L9_HETIT|nr:uncharacterized protein HETIRDRAFT_169734 [Heterobasidion irregulare TC 32-1]ETW80990.1 hypothetical protein HETIRDRAFT_169734 [Heterobasidion irregulare TC 32-1]